MLQDGAEALANSPVISLRKSTMAKTPGDRCSRADLKLGGVEIGAACCNVSARSDEVTVELVWRSSVRHTVCLTSCSGNASLNRWIDGTLTSMSAAIVSQETSCLRRSPTASGYGERGDKDDGRLLGKSGLD